MCEKMHNAGYRENKVQIHIKKHLLFPQTAFNTQATVSELEDFIGPLHHVT